MIDIAQKLHQELRQKIHELDYKGITGVEFYKSCYQLSTGIFKRLRDALTEYKFRNQSDEIEFFKTIKPRLHAEILFYTECYRIELNSPPIREKKAQIQHLRQLSIYYSQLLNKNSPIKLYFITERTEEDNMLFTKSGHLNSFLPFDPLQEFDTLFPPASTEFARIMAYERLLIEINERMSALRKGKQSGLSPGPDLNWTGTKIELIELGYAIHSAKSVNNGQVDLKKIMMGLEQLFNINLGAYSRYFQSLLIRQGSRTPYTEKLNGNLSQRMDDLDLGKG